MYSILRKGKILGLPVDVQLHLFDKVVTPILLYGAEIWGYENIDISEKLQLKFYRISLSANNSTCECMIYGKLGRYPLQMYIDQGCCTTGPE